jgi:hypothetical protein
MFSATLPILFPFLAALALILLNATWVAAEFSIVRVRRTRLEELAGRGVEAAKHVIVVVDRMGTVTGRMWRTPGYADPALPGLHPRPRTSF